ncbi:zinc-binding dehydrogenase [Bacillus testis]|uniref:zinc-binding dehydrogenase n=1 Tax=Bacillus testis TaxID=1622072 RepID=UPI00067EF54E|nr:alcohol dehydrogenase catalytic domain-containing protein [Bacillus testis]
MKALVLEGIKNCTVKEVQDPKLEDHGVLIRVMANGICRSDWHMWIGDIPAYQPIIGHEFSGVIEEVGKNVNNFKKGDRVIVPFTGSDGNCSHCLKGNTHLCDGYIMPGGSYTGGYAEYVAVPLADRNVIAIPEQISFRDAAALGCRFMTAFHGIVDQARVLPGELVAVYGCGGIGLSAINISRAMGANVIAIDINDANLQLAKQMGATHVINSREYSPAEAVKELTNGGADLSVDALGIAQTCLNSINSIRKGGRHLQIGLTTKEEAGFISLPVDHMVLNEIQFITTIGMPVHRYKSMIPLVADGRLTPGKMVNREVSLSEVNDIFEGMTTFSQPGTFVVTKFS